MDETPINMQTAISKHAYFNLSHVSPLVFLYLLRECYAYGYNFQCDVKQLAHSYGELKCFKHFDMLLDIQNVFKEPRGGLSGLAEKILGTGLNKTRRNSNWEQRPLSHYQLEYAALDAAVLLHIFRHVGNHSQPAGSPDGHAKIEWKSHIVSHMDSSKMPKKDIKTGEEPDVGTDRPGGSTKATLDAPQA